MLSVTETRWLPTLCMARIILLFSVTDDISCSLFVILSNSRLGLKTILEGSKLQVWNFAHGINLMEEDLWWKATFDGRQHLMEDNLWWKTAFNERWPSLKKTTFDRRLQWTTTLGWRHPLIQDNLRLKTTFDGTTETSWDGSVPI